MFAVCHGAERFKNEWRKLELSGATVLAKSYGFLHSFLILSWQTADMSQICVAYFSPFKTIFFLFFPPFQVFPFSFIIGNYENYNEKINKFSIFILLESIFAQTILSYIKIFLYLS